MPSRLSCFLVLGLVNLQAVFSTPSQDDLEQLFLRVSILERENAELRKKVETLMGQNQKQSSTLTAKHSSSAQSHPFKVKTHQNYSYEMLDHTSRINQKQQTILDHKASDAIGQGLYVGGSVTPIVDYQKSNRDSKFGYLMRHPTSNNQIGTNVSEAVIHSAEMNITANFSDNLSAYAEFLYDPEQSFGAGTITALARNQVQLRKGYLLYGDLNESPYYVAVGKMAVPFGLTDTVNPFTSSTVWHAFGGLAYSALMGYSKDRWNLRLDAIQGGAQFRAANVPVRGTSVPSRLNNLAIDINYRKDFEDAKSLLFGTSFLKGSAYCQDFPIAHFNACTDHNPAYSVYAKFEKGSTLYQAEFAQTLDEWPGTFNPNPPLNQFSASKVKSFQIGLRDKRTWSETDVDLSLEFSRFESGPSGSPWERQDQLVLGVSHYLRPSVKLFSELIRVSGFAPLNFLSGGHIQGQPQITISDRDARSTVLIMGVDAAF